MRQFPYWTVNRIIQAVKEETEKTGDPLKISRSTFYRLEKENLFMSGRTIGKWRRYTSAEAKIIIHLIRLNYGLEE